MTSGGHVEEVPPSRPWTLLGEVPVHGVVRVDAPSGLNDDTTSLAGTVRAARHHLRETVVVERAATPSLWLSWLGRDRVDHVLRDCDVGVRRDISALDVPGRAHLASLSASDRLLVALAPLVLRPEPLLLVGGGIDFRGAVRICELLRVRRRERLTLWVCDANLGVWPDVACVQGAALRLVSREDVR